jgi:HEAT repeat protein
MKEDLTRIEELGVHGAVEELTSWLGHEDWQLRRAAVDAVVTRAIGAGADARDAIVRHLVQALYSEENAGLRNAAQEALTRLAPKVADRLVAEVREAPTDVRILLAPVLGESGSAEAVRPLVELAQSSDANISTAAIIGLGRLRRREAVGPLLGILSAGNPWLAFPAVEALGVLGDAGAVASLSARLDDPLLGATALEAIVRIGGPEAARAIAARLFANGPMRADRLDAIVRIAQEPWPGELAAIVRDRVVTAFRDAYRPERFDEMAELAKVGSGRVEAALEALGWSGDPRALPVLLVALGRPAFQASASAGLAVLFESRAMADAVGSYAERLAPAVRLEVARILVNTWPVEAAGFVAGLLDDDDPDVARDAAETAADAAARLDATSDGDEARAHATVRSLVARLERVEAPARPSVVRLVTRLVAAVGLDPADFLGDAERLAASAEADLALAGVELLAIWHGAGPRERAALEETMRDPDPLVRSRAVDIAGAAGLPELRPLFTAALADEEPLVRRSAVAALAAFDDDEATRALRAVVGDWHGLVAADALEALAARGAEASETSLLGASRSDRALLRCVAAGALAGIPSEQARARVRELAATDPEFEVRRAAVAALAGAPGAAEAAAQAFEDAHHAVRRAALRVAAEVVDPRLCERVETLADEDESEDVRGEALVTLASCAPERALERLGRAMLDPSLAPYAVRAFGRVAERDPHLLERYRGGEAPPRAAFAIDALRLGTAP